MQTAELQAALAGPDRDKVLATTATFLDAFLKSSGLDRHPVVQGLMEGQTAAQTLGLSRADLDALYAVGFGALTSGDFGRAQDVFTRLALIDPLEARHRYCLGVIAQQRGDHGAAVDHLVNFLALDATNADGYLRLGESFAALGRRRDAAEAFRIALAEALKGNGDAQAVTEARQKLNLLAKEGRA
jgi:tetratricopeptide (TPR) repeat protein